MPIEVPRGRAFKAPLHALSRADQEPLRTEAGRASMKGFLPEGLLARKFVKSKIGLGRYYREKVAVLIYPDNGILVGPTVQQVTLPT